MRIKSVKIGKIEYDFVLRVFNRETQELSYASLNHHNNVTWHNNKIQKPSVTRNAKKILNRLG